LLYLIFIIAQAKTNRPQMTPDNTFVTKKSNSSQKGKKFSRKAAKLAKKGKLIVLLKPK